MIIEMTILKTKNVILNYNLKMNKVVHVCSVFNKICKIIQCFKCYNYEHITIQCTKETRCDHCVDNHSIKNEVCATEHIFKCCLCSENHKSWQKNYSKKQKKIQRIIYQKSITSTRFEIKKNEQKQQRENVFAENNKCIRFIVKNVNKHKHQHVENSLDDQ